MKKLYKVTTDTKDEEETYVVAANILEVLDIMSETNDTDDIVEIKAIAVNPKTGKLVK